MLKGIHAVGTDRVLSVSMVVSVKVRPQLIHFDELPDGSWRITFNPKLIEDYVKLEQISFERDAKGSVIAAHLEGIGKTLAFSKVRGIVAPSRIYIEEGPKGWEMFYSSNCFPDFSQITALKMERHLD